MQSSGALLEAVEDVVVLLVIQLERGLTRSGRVDHELDQALANDGGAEHDGDELVDVGLYFGIKANELKVTTTVATLADHALGYTVHRNKFDLVILSGGLLLQLAQNALEAMELSNEDVGLVHLVSHENEVLLAGKVNDATDILLRQRSTSGVTGVDDYNAADINAVGLGLVVRGADGVEIGTPFLGFVQVVRNWGGVEEGEGGRVERILGDRNHNTTVLVLADDVEQSVDSGRGTGREINVRRVGGESVTS